MKKGKFKKRMEVFHITEFAYDNVWDHLRYEDMCEFRRKPVAWLATRASEMNGKPALKVTR